MSRRAVELVARDLPRPEANSLDFYYWYYGTRFAVTSFEARDLDAWKSAVVKILTAAQYASSGPCRRGAWLPMDRWGAEGGIIYSTAINTLTLEYALQPRPFDLNTTAPDVVAPPAVSWIFKLRNGGKVQAITFEEQPDSYQVKISGGTVKILKDDVEQILKADAKTK